MATASAIIDRAYSLLGFKAAGEALSADDADYALDALNTLVNGWNSQPLFVPLVAGVATAIPAFANLATDYPLAPGYTKALQYSLAEELAPGVKEVPLSVARMAANARRAIRRNNARVPLLDITL